MPKYLPTLRVPSHNPSNSRHHNPRKRLVIKAIVARIRLKHVHEIIKPLKHERLGIKVELLDAMMRGYVIGPGDFKHAPELAVFGVVVQFFDGEI